MLYHSKKLEDTGKLGVANGSQQMVFFSLQCMAKGGMHDHIGGGFHRYSVDECWHGKFNLGSSHFFEYIFDMYVYQL